MLFRMARESDFAKEREIMALQRAARLRGLREAEGFSQRDLANRLDVTIRTIRNWESGFTFPQWEILRRLADFYDVSVVYLRTGQHDVHEPFRGRRRYSG